MSRREYNRPQRPVTLLPAIPGVTPRPLNIADQELPPKPKRHVVLAACEPCRKRKSKCSAERPQCVTCLDRGTECEYVTDTVETRHQALKRKYEALIAEKAALEQLFHLIRTRSESEAWEIYRRVRAGGEPATIVKDITSSEMLLQFSSAKKDSGPSHSYPPSTVLGSIRRISGAFDGEAQSGITVSTAFESHP